MTPQSILREIVNKRGKVLFLTGAGLSADSGIPTFRGPEGYWTIGSQNYMPTEMATQAMFNRYPEKVWEWYLYRFGVCAKAKPNAGHQHIVEFEKLLEDRFVLVSQNIDGLHQEAGSSLERSYYIHGNSAFFRCAAACTKELSLLPENLWFAEKKEMDTQTKQALTCPNCSAWMRPHVLWFDESYDEEYYSFETVLSKSEQADLVFLIGTSGATTLPAYVVQYAREAGAYLVEINPNETNFTEVVESYEKGLVQRGKASDLLGEWFDSVLKMIVAYILVSLYSSWIWIYYLRAIDIFEKEQLKDVLMFFGLGLLTPLVVLFFDWVGYNDLFIGDSWFMVALDSVFGIGLIEELAKATPFLVLFKLVRNKIDEPIDIIIYFAATAIGFSAVENVIYYQGHGGGIILARTILPTLSHIIDSAIVGYGIALYLYKPNHKKIWIPIKFLILAILSHAFYDFWLLYYHNTFLGALASMVYFLFTVSIFSNIITNALNNSPLFSYKKVINPHLLSKYMFVFFGILILVQVIVVGIDLGIERAIGYLILNSIQLLFITFVSVSRLSRFKIIKDRWNPIKLELPFYLVGYSASLFAPLRLAVRGEGFNETYMNSFLYEECIVRPLTLRNSYLEDDFEGKIVEKVFLDKDLSFYILELELAKGRIKKYLLKPKTFGRTLMAKEYPIAALLEIGDEAKLSDSTSSLFDFTFLEWVYLKPLDWGK